jgi:acyl-CoA hydrolase
MDDTPIAVTDGIFTYVAIGDDGRPKPVDPAA